jgi:hypothetical protein
MSPNSAAVLEALPLAAAARRRRMQLRAVQPDYSRDPVGWIEQRLGERLWSLQREIARAVVEHRRVAVPSAHAIGKSFLAARLAAWWLDTRAPGEAFVVTTAPTGAQVKAVLWREINRAHRKARLRGYTNQTEWWIDGEMVAFGRKPADYDPEAFQGIHARAVLVLMDEGGGIPQAIYQAAASLAANEHSRQMVIGNPDDPLSHFATVCRPGSGWHTIHVDGLASPNFTDEKHDLPPDLLDLLIGPTYVAETLADGGGSEDAPLYVSKVRGQFPENASDGVILLSWLNRCKALELEPGLPVELGMDVGAGGDETNIRVRYGPKVGRKWNRKTPDWADAVGMALGAIEETGATRIKVDVIGVGWGVVGRLKELREEGKHACEVVPVNVGAAPSDPARFPKLRDQLWWEVGRELSRDGGWDLGDLDDTTVAQLIAPTYKRDSTNRIHVERKDETRKRLPNGRSPDDADALLLAYYNPPVQTVEFY